MGSKKSSLFFHENFTKKNLKMETISEEIEHVSTKQLLQFRVFKYKINKMKISNTLAKLHRKEKKIIETKVRENAKILVETLHQSEEQSGMAKISKYFTQGQAVR